MADLTEEEIETLKDKHDKIRAILESYGNKEFGDCIIDEICEAVGIPPTTVYYDEDDDDEDDEDDKIACDNCNQEEERDEVFGVEEEDWTTPGYYMVCNNCLNNKANKKRFK